MNKGKLIVLEGSCDAVGKSTQYRLLIDKLLEDKEKVITTHHFPSYGTYQGRPVEEYLKGNYGKISDLSPYFVNSLYAQDRAITWISGLKQEYEKGNIILFDRYTTSSLIYQSTTIEDKEEREKFIDYIYDYEYNKMGLPVPDLVIFLHLPFELANELRKKRKSNGEIQDDIHESDIAFMKMVSDTSIDIANKYNWDFIECSSDNKLRSIEDIHNDVYKLVRKKIYND